MKSSIVSQVVFALLTTGMISMAFAQEYNQWGADRINDRFFNYAQVPDTPFTAGRGHMANIYIVSTGIDWYDDGCWGRCMSGYNAINPTEWAYDDNGMGTLMYNVAANGTYGVARGTSVYPVKVLNEYGWGKEIDIIRGLRWIASKGPQIRGVVVIGFSSNGSYPAIDAEIQNLIDLGFHVIVPAGQGGNDACEISPGGISDAITVAGIEYGDYVPSTMNQGSCVDIFAPVEMSAGTSSMMLGLALVAGVAAVHLDTYWLEYTPAELKQRLLEDATNGMLAGLWPDSPNKLLYIHPGYGIENPY